MRKTKSSRIVSTKNSKPLVQLVLSAALINLIFYTKAEDPFNSPKLIILMISAAYFLGYIVKSIKDNPLVKQSLDFQIIFITLLFLISMFISAVLSEDKLVAFVGDTFRRNGMFAYLSLAILFLLATRLINFSNIILFYKAMILNGFIFSLYGVLQAIGKDFVTWNNPYNAVLGTVGNPNFASAILAVFALISGVALFLKNLSIFYKTFAISTVFMALFGIISSNSRQGLLSFGLGLLFFLSSYAFIKNKKIGFIVITSSFLFICLAIAGMLQRGPLTQLLYKDSVSIRGFYWDAGLAMLRQNPVFGVGIDHYGLFFKEYVTADYSLRVGYELTSSNAHNTIIQFFATGGFFVGSTYLLILFFIFFTGIKLLRNSDNTHRLLSLGLLSSWVCFQAQSFISIDNIGVSVWGWMLGGAIIGLVKDSRSDILISATKGKVTNRSNSLIFLQQLVSFTALIPTFIIVVLLFRGETNSFKATGYVNSGLSQLYTAAQVSCNAVLNNPFADQYYKLKSVQLLAQAGFTSESYERLNELYSKDTRNTLVLGLLAAQEKSRGDIKKSIYLLNKIAEYEPWNAKNYLELLILNKQLGNLAEVELLNLTIQSFASGTEIGKIALKELG